MSIQVTSDTTKHILQLDFAWYKVFLECHYSLTINLMFCHYLSGNYLDVTTGIPSSLQSVINYIVKQVYMGM